MNNVLMAHEINSAALDRISDQFEVTAWGDAERKFMPALDRRFNHKSPTTTLGVSVSEIQEAKLTAVFDEARHSGAVIIMPDSGTFPQVTKELRDRMRNAWGKLPPYIEVPYRPGDYFYSIKPVWELTA